MKIYFLAFHLILANFWSVFPAAHAREWVFQSGNVVFEIKNAGLTVVGKFNKIKAEVSFDPADVKNAKIQGVALVNSIQTGISLRDNHLLKSTYFHEEKFPEIQMKLSRLDRLEANFNGHFSISMKGVTRTLVIPIDFDEKSGILKTKFNLNRRDFGIGSSSWTMSDEVKVSIIFQLTSYESKN